MQTRTRKFFLTFQTQRSANGKMSKAKSAITVQEFGDQLLRYIAGCSTSSIDTDLYNIIVRDTEKYYGWFHVANQPANDDGWCEELAG